MFYSRTDMMIESNQKNETPGDCKTDIPYSFSDKSKKTSIHIKKPLSEMHLGPCRGICQNYLGNKSRNGYWYDNGQTRCQTCMVFLTAGGVELRNGRKVCKCCHINVRTRPHNSATKQHYLEQNNSNSDFTYSEADDEFDEETENTFKKTTPIYLEESTDKKSYSELGEFIEEGIRLQANYQLVMLKYLISHKIAHKGEIAESLAYFNNKDISSVHEITKFFNVPVYDVLVKRGFVNEFRRPNSMKEYTLNVELSEYQQYEINDLLEKRIEEWNREHGIAENQFESTGINWNNNLNLLHEPSYWIWSVTPENWEIVKTKNIWGSKIPYLQIQRRILPNDFIVFYVVGTKTFKGIFQVKGDWYDNSSNYTWHDEQKERTKIYKSGVELVPIVLGTAKIEELNNLLIFEGKSQDLVNLVLKGGSGYPSNNGKPIPHSDYSIVKDLLEKNPELELSKKELEKKRLEQTLEASNQLESNEEKTTSANRKIFENDLEGITISEMKIINQETMKVGQILTNDELCQKFGVGNMGGIRYSSKNNLIVLCDTLSSPYNDQINQVAGIILYTGEGLVGNQEFTGGNYRIANSNHIPIFYFLEVPQESGMKKRGALDNIYKIIGKVKYLKHSIKVENDTLGNPRNVIKFVLEIEK